MWWLAGEAWACGGFFCGNPPDPVVQTEERLLFEVGDNGDVTTWVEIQYEGDPTDFAWILPVLGPIDPVEGIRTAPPGLFDQLELATAPVFVELVGPALDSAGAACGGPCADYEGSPLPPPPDTSGVEVVGQAVVGPYAIEVLTATEGDNLVNWLLVNGYAFPTTAADPLDHYIALGMQFVAVKLLPDVREGPIDTLVVDCAAGTPTIPLLLTAIASAPSLEITAYVLDDVRYGPTNTAELAFDWGAVERLPDGTTTYEPLLEAAALDAGEIAWNTEFVGGTADLLPALDPEVADVLAGGATLTRLHTFVAPEHMVVDPSFGPAPGPDVPREHVLGDAGVGAYARASGLALLVGLALRRRVA